jgi:hypothetical protein
MSQTQILDMSGNTIIDLNGNVSGKNYYVGKKLIIDNNTNSHLTSVTSDVINTYSINILGSELLLDGVNILNNDKKINSNLLSYSFVDDFNNANFNSLTTSNLSTNVLNSKSLSISGFQ